MASVSQCGAGLPVGKFAMTNGFNLVYPADRCAAASGRVQLTGVQALARLPIDQHRRDQAAERNVATFISGYEGSPLAGYDLELARQRKTLQANDVTVVPALNEEAAATAIQGTQLAPTLDGATRDGVLGIWYGKAPGLDRASDALRHGNLMGANPNGGALVLVGDDPAAKSSSVPCASEVALADLNMPFLYPADSQDVLDLGLHAIELSRTSGLWVGLKIVTAVADGSSTVELTPETHTPAVPTGSKKHVPTGRLLQPTLGPLERDLVTTRLRLAKEYSRLNHLNKVVGRGPSDVLGVVAAGRTYLDVLSALTRMGISEADLEASGLRLLRVAMPWPLDEETIHEFADGLREIVVVEEKRSFLESALRDVLYHSPSTPAITGKRDLDGGSLIRGWGDLDVDTILSALTARCAARGIPVASATLSSSATAPSGRRALPLVKRTPFFCSGCPHNSSTRHSTDSLVGGGIGCHAMVLLMDESRVGEVTGLCQMGGEGLQWIGMAPYLTKNHFVQNLGDGTFDHSGSLAIRAAVAANVNITYKLLFNSAVAMTGGQRAVGGMGVRQVVDILLAEGVSRVIVTTEDLARYKRIKLPRGVAVWDRSRLHEAERALAPVPGVTVLLHDQECATEKRRRRKRVGDKPEQRIFINERVCEGCGDCGGKSGCLSVQPVSTEYGRKTQIHQSSCNFDYSCVEGDCPAFMSVALPETGPSRAGAGAQQMEATDLPDPMIAVPRDGFTVRLTGVGGTGVVTVSQVLAFAGLLAGWTARSLDQTGLAQKGGAVVSDVVFDRQPRARSNKLAAGECDLYLGCDLLVAADPENLAVTSPDKTITVLSTSRVPTGAMVTDPGVTFPDPTEAAKPILAQARPQSLHLDARDLTKRLLGDDQFANLFLVGAAFQLGALPLPAEAIEEAVGLNGVAVIENLQAFRRGRQFVADPDALRNALPADDAPGHSLEATRPGSESLEQLVRSRTGDLVAYQDHRYARPYEELVNKVREAERRTVTDSTELTEAVARHLYKLMAYKDEYEVARLSLDSAVQRQLETEFGPGAKASWKLHPPVLRAMGMKNKVTLGPWFTPGFRALRAMRRLRGTPLDPFGHAQVRKVERELVREYIGLVEHLVETLTPANIGLAVDLARLPDMVRGYEDIKLQNVENYHAAMAELRRRFDTASPAADRPGREVASNR